ncbi:MFS general substrate transporter [Acephala macrosclerotiorum]|nr:MFS general substrate transporter [Acephala macrosclerotiorum]
MRLVPLLSFLGPITYADRSNIGNAKIAGMSTDLNLISMGCSTALTVFFVPYSLFEVPSNIILKILRPSIWISILCFAWRLVMTLMGCVSTYHGLVVAPFFLGVAEAGFFPAATCLLTICLLAYAIEKMNGIAGLTGWKWIFILEAKFLTKEEREFVINRIALQTGSGQGRVIMAIVPFWACSIGTYGFAATVPSVLEEMGYTTVDAQLLTIPIYVFALITTVVVTLSDHYQQRTPFITGGFAITVVGRNLFLSFLVAAGLYCLFTCVTLVGNNLVPSSKRAVGMALMISIGNMGGICGSNIYFAAEEPKYPAEFGTSLGICAAGIVAAFILRKAYQRENRRRDELLVREGEEATRAKYTEQELLDLGDLSPFYRYTT